VLTFTPANKTQLTNGAYTVTLGSTGNLTWAGGAYIGPNGGAAGEIDIIAGTADGAASLGSYDLKNYMYVDNDGPEIWSNSTNVWKFGLDGKLTFPDTTVQTTAYQKVAVPAHSYGAAGDKVGMVAFDANYIYYCKTAYVNNSTNIWVRVAWSGTTW
jgi:hypothetical protein